MMQLQPPGITIRLFSLCCLFFLCSAPNSFANQADETVAVARASAEAVVKPVAQVAGDAGSSIPIRLSAGQFDPLQSFPMSTRQISSLDMSAAEQQGYYIVQFDGPVEESWKKSLQAMGVEIFDYVPDFAFIVKFDSGKTASIAALAHVRWLGEYHPSYRVSQAAADKALTKPATALDGAISSAATTPPIELRVTAFPEKVPQG